MTMFGRLRRSRAMRERDLKDIATSIVNVVAGPEAKAWWKPVGEGRPVIVPVVIGGVAHSRELEAALHAELQRAPPLSRELDFIVVRAENTKAIQPIANAAMPLIPLPLHASDHAPFSPSSAA